MEYHLTLKTMFLLHRKLFRKPTDDISLKTQTWSGWFLGLYCANVQPNSTYTQCNLHLRRGTINGGDWTEFIKLITAGSITQLHSTVMTSEDWGNEKHGKKEQHVEKENERFD